MKYEIRIMNYMGFGEYRSAVVKVFDSYDEASEYNRLCHENGFNTFIETVNLP